MAIKDNFLREIKIGDSVKLMADFHELTGIVISLDTETAHILTAAGTTYSVCLGTLSYYEINKGITQSDCRDRTQRCERGNYFP